MKKGSNVTRVRTSKPLARAVFESESLQLEILGKSRDSDTHFLGVGESYFNGIYVKLLPVGLLDIFEGLNLGQYCIKKRNLDFKLIKILTTAER